MKLRKLIHEGTWSCPNKATSARVLAQLMQHPIPASTSTDALYNLVGDDQLFDALDSAKDHDPHADVRPLVIKRLKQWLHDDDAEWRDPWDPEAIQIIKSIVKSNG